MNQARRFGKAGLFGGALLAALFAAGLTTAAAQTTLEYWAWVEGSEEAVALWNETHPDVQVNFTRSTAGTEHYNKVKTAVAAGSGGPDVAPVTTMLVSSWNSTCATSGPPDPAATAVLTLL